MSGRFASVVQQQATTMVPGALFAFALTLPLTRHRVLWHLKVEEVYFELHDIILYASDLMLLVVIATWLLTPARGRVKALPRWLLFALLALPLLAAISATWALYPYLALFQAGRLALLLGLFLVVATASEARGALAWGVLVSGAIQAGIGLGQFIRQGWLGLRDLGEMFAVPTMRGASVVTAGGVPTLRAYGLTPHPNLLGGLLMAAVLTGLGLTLSRRSTRGPTVVAAGLTTLSFIGLLLSFSRAAWLGTAVGGAAMLAILWLGRKKPGEVAWRAALVVAGAILLVTSVFAATQWPLLQARLGLAVEGVEIRSADERSGLEASAWMLIREHPWLGVGYGNFTLALFQRRPPAMEAYPVYQPVHRTPLLALAEIGLPGALIWLVLTAGPWLAVWRQRRTWPAGGVPLALAAAALGVLGGLTMVGFFDFYPWYSTQGRPLMWIYCGLLAQSLASRRGYAALAAPLASQTSSDKDDSYGRYPPGQSTLS